MSKKYKLSSPTISQAIQLFEALHWRPEHFWTSFKMLQADQDYNQSDLNSIPSPTCLQDWDESHANNAWAKNRLHNLRQMANFLTAWGTALSVMLDGIEAGLKALKTKPKAEQVDLFEGAN